ncbi:MAG: hypothetical protein IJT18_08040 [Oscillospiraceae bacterium]|nr:hypothetical protein [Oscillospiraceae bacterium]
MNELSKMTCEESRANVMDVADKNRQCVEAICDLLRRIGDVLLHGDRCVDNAGCGPAAPPPTTLRAILEETNESLQMAHAFAEDIFRGLCG